MGTTHNSSSCALKIFPSPWKTKDNFYLLSKYINSLFVLVSRTPHSHETDRLTEIVYPIKLDCFGISRQLRTLNKTNIICPENNKNRQSNIFYKIKIKKIELFLQLELNDLFLAPVFQVEQRFGDLYREAFSDEEDRKCFYQGKIINEHSSSVTLNICGGLVSYI